MRPVLVAVLALIPLAACSTVKEAVHGPQLSAVGYPAELMPMQQQVAPFASAREPMPQQATANSLWRTGARSFFKDQRAQRVGDILTVQIDIDDQAQFANTTQRSRQTETSGGVSNFFGLESSLGKILPGEFDPEKAIGFGSETSTNGAGVVNRSEKVSLTVAALVTQVLPNGNMVIQGRQEVRTNHELRELTVAGIVRPEDITATNTIRHTQIAEARISYGGRGDLSRVQHTPAGQAIVERFSPF